ncbi:MAG TPA: M61 family metallopeptidase [Rhodocyclaceae bacterium]|nr:M61 family metallopeptidase [Rhodocyclaceae bacterium]
MASAAPDRTPIRYVITPIDPGAHLFEVTLTLDAPDPAGQRFTLPAWIPGSYMIREFARNIVRIAAKAGAQPVALRKLDKHTWQADPLPPRARRLTVTCEVYAWDLSVRGAHLDATHGFFNGTSVFLRVEGREDAPCLVDIRPPNGGEFRDWRVATTLPAAVGERGAAAAWGFGLHRAANYDELIDHPVEMGRFTLASFKAGGVPHDVAITGRHNCDATRLVADLARICAWQIRLFHGPRGKPPFARFLFLVTAVGEGYGGLEHRTSTALLCSRNDLPAPAMGKMTEAYRGFLGLCSHEYFHCWNVKRIQPAAFQPYDLTRENYTTLLWAFEGFTSYYDDIALVKSGAITPEAYLELLGKTIAAVQRGSGRLKQSVAESSFDAWIKYYRQDENSPNAVVSYYTKGALIALALDLTLRSRSDGRVSLDDLMRELWRRHGATGRGVEKGEIPRLAEEISGLKLRPLFAAWVHGTGELPLKPLLAAAGVELEWETAGSTPSLGVRTLADGADLKLANVYDGGPAQAAGLSANDVLCAIDGLRVTRDNLDKLLARHRGGDAVDVHAFRRDELMRFTVKLAEPPRDVARLRLADKAGKAAQKMRKAWIGT